MLPTAKVVLLGAAGAGKTAFVDRVAKGVFNPRPACKFSLLPRPALRFFQCLF